MPQLKITNAFRILIFGILVVWVSSLMGCTQKTTHIQKDSVLASTNSVTTIEVTNTAPLPISDSTIKLSPEKKSTDQNKSFATKRKKPTSIAKSSITYKKDSQHIYHKPKELLGMGALAVSDFLGVPSLIRRETPAQVWQYISENCILNIYLYMAPISPESFEVTYYEFYQAEKTQNSDEICFSKIIKNARTAPNETPSA